MEEYHNHNNTENNGTLARWLFSTVSRSSWVLECVFFGGERKTVGPGKKTLGARTTTSYKLNPHVTPGPGTEPEPQRWEASALTTAHPHSPQPHYAHSVRSLMNKPFTETEVDILN